MIPICAVTVTIARILLCRHFVFKCRQTAIIVNLIPRPTSPDSVYSNYVLCLPITLIRLFFTQPRNQHLEFG